MLVHVAVVWVVATKSNFSWIAIICVKLIHTWIERISSGVEVALLISNLNEVLGLVLVGSTKTKHSVKLEFVVNWWLAETHLIHHEEIEERNAKAIRA
jgi:hypothetical protein